MSLNFNVGVPPEPLLHTPPVLAPLLAELQRLEPLFHAAAPGATEADYEALVAPGFWEIGASGRRYSRAFALAVLRARGATPEATSWRTSHWHLQQPAPGLALLSYRLQQGDRLTERSTLWQQQPDGRWQALFHQGTVVQPPAP